MTLNIRIITKSKKGLKNLSFDILVSVSTFAGRGRATSIKIIFNQRAVSMKKKKYNIYKGYYSSSTLPDFGIVYTESKGEKRKRKIMALAKIFVDIINIASNIIAIVAGFH